MGGIYGIFNTKNGRVYIGSTNNFQTRKAVHFRQLKQFCHPNYTLQEDYILYGESSFYFQQIMQCKDEELLRKERELINRLETAGKSLYNKAAVIVREDNRCILIYAALTEKQYQSRDLKARAKYIRITPPNSNKSMYLTSSQVSKSLGQGFVNELHFFPKIITKKCSIQNWKASLADPCLQKTKYEIDTKNFSISIVSHTSISQVILSAISEYIEEVLNGIVNNKYDSGALFSLEGVLRQQ